MYFDYQQCLIQCRSLNQERLLEALNQAGIIQVEVEYSGCGDSGEVSDLSLTPDDVTLDTTTQLTWFIPEQQPEGSPVPYIPGVLELSLEDAIKEFALRWVDHAEPGWEIDDGSFGTVTIEVLKRHFTLDHTMYYTEDSCHEIAA